MKQTLAFFFFFFLGGGGGGISEIAHSAPTCYFFIVYSRDKNICLLIAVVIFSVDG